MIDPVVIVCSIIGVFIILCGVLLMFAVVSNKNHKSVKTLEKANARLIEMRKEYGAYQDYQEKNG